MNEPIPGHKLSLIIAGGRDYKFTPEDRARLDRIPKREIVHGGAKGADAEGANYAAIHNLPVKEFPAHWHLHGPRAGPMRNQQMAEYADAVALFPGGKGTASMRREARKAGIMIYDFTGQDDCQQTLI